MPHDFVTGTDGYITTLPAPLTFRFGEASYVFTCPLDKTWHTAPAILQGNAEALREFLTASILEDDVEELLGRWKDADDEHVTHARLLFACAVTMAHNYPAVAEHFAVLGMEIPGAQLWEGLVDTSRAAAAWTTARVGLAGERTPSAKTGARTA
ncbi:hypothetical protein [Streptomyces noursei]